MSTSNSNIVVEWLRSLHLGQYAESFLDNGYDDLEICKQVGDPDLDAIGVFNPSHRNRLLQSVRTLREEGAASVYFTLEESAAIQEECQCDSASARSSRASSGRVSDKEVLGRSPAGSSSAGSAQELTRYLDEYEEGKAELIRIPRLQLKLLLKEKLTQDGIRLSNQPYSTSEGQRGYLEGLASRYADLFNTHYRDVLDHLEELRKREWAELSPRIRVLGTPSTPPGPAPSTPLTRVPLTTSHSQPIYVPGKYSPSSCLSDKEEDEIYGFAGYGVYGKQMLQRQQQQAKLVITPRQNYQNCLSPRSAYFYEFPPNERPGKKRTSFTRFLRHLTTHRKDKSSSPRQQQQHMTMSRGGTPDNLDTPPTLLPPMDYDRLRYLPKNQNSPNTFEETIHRLKIQEALKKKERFDREHEEILRDIRQGLLQLGRQRNRSSDDTYMYDDEMQRLGQHWYDEPPYESDPEDFLMADTANNSRVCFTLNVRTDGRSSGESAVISLRSAGDISLPHHQRGLLLPQSGPYPPTLIPLTHARNHRESGDYAASDVQSICSRLSSLSMETSRSETTDPYQRLRSYNGVESAISPGHSSDYAEQDELVTVHSSCGNSSMAHRVRGLKGDNTTGKVISSRHPHHHHHHHNHNHHHHRHHKERSPEVAHHSSAESLPSGSSTQALVPPSSNPSSEESHSPSDKLTVIARARALVDYTPSPYDKDVLKFKKGDTIEVLSMNASGLWRGRAHGRVGNFKFINVELLTESSLRPRPCRHRPQTLEQMLRTIHMEDHMSLFVLNGYEDLDAFCEIKEADLDYLNIHDLQQRAKILAAVQVLNEYESPDECGSSADEGQNSQCGTENETQANNLGVSENTTTATINCKEAAQVMQQTYLPNIPLRSSHTLEMDVFSEKTAGDTVVEKVGVVKYIGQDLSCESGNPQNRNCSTLSEKSSDSGMIFQVNEKASIPVGKT
ncbi:uncharacterized protein LOC128990108 isoform X2 [Macrosteles quadrilineatus]|uniref:uncharacterized protein LOC128990108 isoform X2 n=1 Tax=Macrosteles quadrilineatus TaxID=74068 RepID=UPI0023E0B967|nr:uncharacterized protein LOC128990108 isoform X2 [Macrosteles quadrilineatus]